MQASNLWRHLRYLRHLPRPASSRVVLALLAACVLGLAACGTIPVQGGGGSGTPTPSYGTGAGHILIQLYNTAGFIYPPIVGIPEWTLYGDGTLLTQNLPGQTAPTPSGLLVAHLSTDQVAHILDMVVNQYAFFASTRDAFGRPIADVGVTRFTVNAGGQSKTVSLLPEIGPSPDQQTTNVFAAAKFLRAYKPASTSPYQAPGVGLLVFKAAVGSTVPAERAWPFSDVSLAIAYAYNCSYLRTGTPCPATPGGSPGLTAVYGARSAAILSFLVGTSGTVAQNGGSYLVLALPLLPDSLHPDTGAPGLRVMFSSGEQWTPLVAAQPAA